MGMAAGKTAPTQLPSLGAGGQPQQPQMPQMQAPSLGQAPQQGQAPYPTIQQGQTPQMGQDSQMEDLHKAIMAQLGGGQMQPQAPQVAPAPQDTTPSAQSNIPAPQQVDPRLSRPIAPEDPRMQAMRNLQLMGKR